MSGSPTVVVGRHTLVRITLALLFAVNRYAREQIQFRDDITREFENAAALKDEALKQKRLAEEKVRRVFLFTGVGCGRRPLD